MDSKKIIRTIQNEQLSKDELGELLWLLNCDQYKERPVSIQEFIASDDFVHKKWPNIFPLWKETLSELFPTPFNAPYNEVLISAAAGSGKCLKKGTEVLLYNGQSKKVEDIVIGDQLLGPDLKPRNVLSLGNGIDTMYDIITPIDKFTCNEAHILSLKNEKGQVVNLPILEYFKKDEAFKKEFLSYDLNGKLYPFKIEPQAKGEYYGFTIDGDHLYSLCSGLVTHNTVTSTISIMYDIYKLGCLKDPCRFYGLTPDTMIIMAIFSATGSTAAVNWNEITTAIESCPWIMSKLVDKRGLEKKHGSIVPVQIIPGIYIQTGSKFQHSMGKAIFDGLMDEAAFGGANMKDAQKSYNELSSRIKTRFSNWGTKGNTPGHLFLISSPKEAGDFMQYRIEKAQESGSQLTKVMQNIATWEADPRKDSDDKFTVFIGNENKEPCIYEPGEDVPFEEMDYLIYPPMRYYEDFKKDLLISIMNYGGITTTSDMALFKGVTALNETCVLGNPFKSDVIELPFSKTDKSVMDFIDKSYFENIRHPEYNRFIHIDAAFSTNTLDVYGLAASYSIFVDNSIISDQNIDPQVFSKKDRLYFTDFVVGITAPKGEEVPLYKVQDFIEWLSKMGYPIASISADTFQSKQTLQNLQVKGFETESISVDRSRDPYLFLRQLIYNKQVILPKNEYFKTELKKLRDDGKKVDHPNCFTGDTLINIPNSESITIKSLAEKGVKNTFKVFTCNQGRPTIFKGFNAHQSGIAKDLIELNIEDTIIKCTPEHKFLLSNGIYKEAQHLTEKDSLQGFNCVKHIKNKKWLLNVNEPVYDISVPEYHNFFIENKVFVHNSWHKDLADAVAGSVWNCAKSNKILNTAVIAREYYGGTTQTYSPEKIESIEMQDFERIKQNLSNMLKGL